ncbi:MAG: hypothetical protein FWE44_07575 [Defluviitaleaceae bacterium]|nr:hypothetical protein [Defluviitaleaceae bacterium]
MQNMINIQEIPEPFSSFLSQNTSAQEATANARDNSSSDLLFLAAILMLCDD